MVTVVRTPDERFEGIRGADLEPHWHEWTEPGGTTLRMHYLDEGDGPPILLLHGQPSWSVLLYRDFIPRLVAAGHRVIAPDYIGFGKSDKVVEDEWYVIERHCEALRSLIDALDLRDVSIAVHDWSGPIGLRQVRDMPARFSRIFIFNTWLHHIDMKYTPAIRAYHARIAELEVGTGDPLAMMGQGDGSNEILATFLAPFPDPTHMAGPRRFPLMHPYADPEGGNAIDQARSYEFLLHWPKPAHVIFSHDDGVFRESWGREWAQRFPFGTFDAVSTTAVHHFPQITAADAVVDLMLGYLAGD